MGYGLLKGKKGVIFGALDETSLGWQAALRCKEEGAQLTLSNAPIARKLGSMDALAKQCEAEVIYADGCSVAELEATFERSAAIFGGKIDFVLHAIASSNNIRKKRAYGDLNYDWFMKTLDVSALSFHKMMHCLEKGNYMRTWGSIACISFDAAHRNYDTYSDMAEGKALLESITRSYGARFGKLNKVRVNAIAQSPSETRAAMGIPGFDKMHQHTHAMAPLGNADAKDFAACCVFLFSDLSRRITMQTINNDGGYSKMGVRADGL